MPDKVTIVRPDGTLLDATPEQASRLQLLGYREQTPEENTAQLAAESKADYYGSGDQRLAALGEGIQSGLTFGGTDYLFGNDETKLRATYSPGTRLAGEAIGAFAPLLLSAGESLAASAGRAVDGAGVLSQAARTAEFAPTNLLSRGVEAATAGMEGGLSRSVVRGALEGSAYGVAGAADHAWLDGQPITAEAVLHGLGWGAVLGGGLGALGEGLSKLGEDARGASEAALREPVKPGPNDLRTVGGGDFEAVRSEATTYRGQLETAVKSADSGVRGLLEKELPADLHPIQRDLATAAKEGAQTSYDKIMKLADAGKAEPALKEISEFSSNAKKLADYMGTPEAASQTSTALKQIVELRRVSAELQKFPGSIEQFASMTPQKAERLFAAIEAGQKAAVPADSLHSATQGLADSLGLQSEKSGLRETWVAAKKMYKAGTQEAKVTPTPQEETKAGFGRKVLGYALGGKAYAAVRATGAGKGAAYGAYLGVKNAVIRPGAGTSELGAIRNAVVARVRTAAGDYLPGAGKAVSAAAPISPLATSLVNGRMDSDTKDLRELAKRRAQEVSDLGPTIKNYLYQQLQTMNTAQPELAPAIHQAGLTSFAALQAMMPRDPGARDKLQSLWKPSDVAAVIMSKQLEVFHDPVGVAEQMLSAGQFDPIKTKALRELAPNIWQDMRLNLLRRVTSPEVQSKLSYQEQIGLSAMLDIPLHSSMDPKYIVMSQQMFQDRNEPLKANPRMGQAGPGTLPNPQDNVNSTAADRVTAR